MQRRDALKLGLGAGATAALAGTFRSRGFVAPPHENAESMKAEGVARLRLAPLDVELAPGIMVRTIAFDGTVPGPQLTRGSRLTHLDLRNDGDSDTVVHSSAFSEPLITIPAHTCTRTQLRETHPCAIGVNLNSYRAYCAVSGTIAAGAIIAGTEPGTGVSAVDQLHVLSIHRWHPRTIIDSAARMGTAAHTETRLAYDYASFNDKLMSASEPIKVRNGDRVRFHFSNTHTRRGVTLALAQHRFLIVALDGHDVPTPRQVERVHLGPSERVDAIVTMNRPGRWILGATHRDDRAAGLGRLVEYAGATGHPVESEYGMADWDYTGFGDPRVAARPLATQRSALTQSLNIVRRAGSTDACQWDPTPKMAPIEVSAGKRHRFAMTNFTREVQSLQVLHHDVEIVAVAGRRTAGLTKDTITLPSLTRVEFEFEPRSDGVLLAHNRHVSLEGGDAAHTAAGLGRLLRKS
jgi:FtsP/CotA-like multicopper oxidase with cupredoxin domain